MKTQYEALEDFRQELLEYSRQPLEKGDELEAARQDACQACAHRLEQIMATTVYADGVVGTTFTPGDAAVVVSVPSGFAPTLFRFDREEFGEGGNPLDLMVACTLLEHALQKARTAYSQTRSAQQYGGYSPPPVLPVPAPGF